MTAANNLRRDEAAARAALLRVSSYDITLDLTTGPTTFASTSTVVFDAEDGAATFLDLAAERIVTASLNGQPIDTDGFDGARLPLTGLAAHNELTVVADCVYSRTGEGLHRFVDPVDETVYLYSQFETYDAHRMYACFDQPDLKAAFTLHVTAPADWVVITNGAAVDGSGDGRWDFVTTPRMSTYITALIAGPYHQVTDVYAGPAGEIPLGLYCRRSLADHLDAEELFTITRQGFDFYHRVFDFPYPFGKYDQLFVPEFNAGAMENAGAVTFLEDYVFRSKVTDARYERRAETILHEMAHMWFGDLVTMRWWDDLWLNESFASYMAVLSQAEATRWVDAWTTFCNTEKTWAYRQDQLPSTHPIAADAVDIETVKANFDGITYAKGASVLKQLVAWVGQEEFLAGLREYFRQHAFGNTRLADLLAALHDASGRDLSDWAKEWLSTAGVNTLRARFDVGDDGAFTGFTVLQEAPADHPTLRSHRIAIGLYDRAADGRLTRRDRLELDVVGAATEVPKLIGVARPDVLLLNDDDLTYAKIRLDDDSLAVVTAGVGGFDDSLARALCWAAAWDMTRDAEMPARDFVEMVSGGITAEDQIGLVHSLLAKASLAITSYGDPAEIEARMTRLAATELELLRGAAPGSDLQLAYATAFAGAATSSDQVAALRAMFDGTDTPDGLAVDTDLRWTLLTELVVRDAATAEEVEAEAGRDRTAAGAKRAATARASRPDAAAKAAAWAAVMESDDLSNHLMVATMVGFWRPSQLELLTPYAERFLAEIAGIWSSRTTEMAHTITTLLYPGAVVSADVVDATQRYLEEKKPNAGLARILAEGRDGVSRALRARACDLAAG